MKVVLAGAYGNLGADVFRSLISKGHEVIALDMMQRDIGVDSGFSFFQDRCYGSEVFGRRM
jgi:nucleoside-diphosphate-sugar epimerase